MGYAGWYGAEAHGNETANGETFVASAITAAHRTLPLPSYVEVTALDSGRTILVRVNDRGPFANDRIIDLSQGAAEQLGVTGDGHVPVRVRRVNPPDQERAVLRARGRVAERLETPPALLKALREKLGAKPAVAMAAPPVKARPGKAPPKAAPPKPGPAVAMAPPASAPGVDFKVEEPPVPEKSVPAKAVAAKAAPSPRPPVASGGGYVVQIGAFSTRERAEALAKKIGASSVPGKDIWRVRYGPYPTQDAAEAGVKLAAAKGFENARIMANDAP
mgnify:CR=1 FL=1